MKQQAQSGILALTVGILFTLTVSSKAAVVFSEDFNGYVNGNQNALQFESGLKVSHSGDLPGWNKAGGGVVHAVDKNGTGDFAPMFWQDNVITQAAGIAANDSLISYTVEFSAGPAVYAAGSQATAATDGMVIDVLRGDSTVLATYTHLPGAWAGAQTFAPGSFQYIGDGSGPVRLRIGPLVASGHFAGAMDNLRVVRGTIVYADDFNGFNGGNQNALQFESGLKVSFGGNLPGWDKAGDGVVHAVDRNGTGDYAPMFWQNNVITMTTGIPANSSLVTYTVEFQGGPAVYAAGSQATDGSDGMVIDVLRGDNTVMSAYTHLPGAWAGAQTFAPGSFQYVGDGSGPVRLRVGPLLASGHFAGAMDNLIVSSESAAMPPGIANQPVGGAVVEGSDFTFTVESTGPVTYQWRKNGNAIAGATSASYSLTNVKLADAGTYTVVLANASGSVTSDPAVLTVTAAPTFATYTEAVLNDNPIHYYPLNETSGTAAADLGSLATAGGTYAGGFTLGQASATPRLGNCVRLDGAPGSLVDLGLFHPGDSITVEAWANLDPSASHNPAFHIVVSRWDGSHEIDIAPGDIPNFNVRRDGNGFGQAAGAGAVTRGTWHHFVLVFADGKVTGYVNGVKGSEANIGGVLQNAGPSPDRVMIGATRSGTASSFNWKGLIDEVAFYDYALSPAQIRSHFRAVEAAPPSLAIQPSVTVTWPTFPPGYVLQCSGNVAGPYTNYTGTIFTEGSFRIAPVPIGPAQKFFQLFRP